MIGKKILVLRKKNNLSQEMLAEKLNVTRQTISNWELGETVPDLKQALELAKIFDVSLDEITNNSKQDIILAKVNNTENNSKIILKMLKIIGITISILLFLTLVAIVSSMVFTEYFSIGPTGQGEGTTCYYNGEYISYEVWKDYQSGNISLITTDEEIRKKFKTYDYTNNSKMLNDIVEYIESKGGTCRVVVDDVDAEQSIIICKYFVYMLECGQKTKTKKYYLVKHKSELGIV